MENCTLVVPALNEADNIQHVLDAFRHWPRNRFVVVDNGSEDATAAVAAEFGVVVLQECRRGKGFAVVKGAKWACTDYVFMCDADIRGITESSVFDLMSALGDRNPMGRLSIMRSPENSQVTHLTARPLLAVLGMGCVAEPIGGLTLISRRLLVDQHLHGGWGFDIDLTISTLRRTGKIPEVEVPGISEREKTTSSLTEMATEVLRAALQTVGLISWDHEDCTKCC